VTDPATGALLTSREHGPIPEGARPEHDLDYFHGALYLSPAGEWLADDGWVWHPVGRVRAFSLARWLEENVWESEDGASARSVCERSYFWGGSICWTGPRTLAVWGLGDDEERIVPGVRIFDVGTGEETSSFVGPDGELAFDEFLFAFSQEKGTTVWDAGTGERLAVEPSLKPLAYHHRARCFLSVMPDGGLRLSRLQGSL
jgi:hypothetical protein